ncbi:MAG: DUF2735 domain-containing protein [Hyphomicrobiaceae bacterium]|nr:DUF2735 domain-containing protein [Hyphomicrobiaceae bacterium]
MTMASERGSAKIYQFPVKARAAASYRSNIAAMELAARQPRIEYGSSRYHDAAIAEDAQSRKRDGH